jgi:putative ABC transport system permease protein
MAVSELVRRIDPMVPLFDVQSLDELLANSFAPRKFDMYLFGAFAGVALLLAAIGLFGLTSYNVSQRIREIGLRRALGAEPRDILRLILGHGVTLAATGAVIGVCAAFGLTRVMQSLLFSVSTTDPGTFVTVPTLLVLVALMACYIPARRATKVDPMVALRCE